MLLSPLPEKVPYLDLSHASILPTFLLKATNFAKTKVSFLANLYEQKCWITSLQIHLAQV